MSQRLLLFGAPRWSDGAAATSLPVDKPASLLYHLAQRGDWVTRGELAFLYRPDAEADLALANVRKLLHRAREHPWAAGLEVERFRVRFAVESDAGLFRQAVTAGRWADALELYTGGFLEGLSFSDVPGYDAWLDLERADFERMWQRTARAHAQQLELSGESNAAGGVLEGLLHHDPLDEEALQAYLHNLSARGLRKQALEVFEMFRSRLATELEVEPLEATRALVDAIRHGGEIVGARASADSSESLRHNLAAPTTRFVGRKRELAKLAELLSQTDGRLVSLVGLGGVGKTRLATEFAWSQAAEDATYPDGVWFVALAGLVEHERLAPTLAATLGLKLSGSSDPQDQLFAHLRSKQMLLVLDNFEHLIEGAGLVAALLEAAADVRVVTTTRSALELSGEWLMDLEGLACPPLGATLDFESFDAVKLFVNRAERVAPNFVLDTETLQSVATLCRQLEGLPLALELAATLTRSLSVAQIVTELEQGLARLSTTQRDVPERHRSLRAVFEHSWGLLSTFEREVITRLSVFRGSFTLKAAINVAGAHLAGLTSLINRSLVRRSTTGRYEMHEFIRQLALERLESELHAINVKDKHAEFFMARLEEIEAARANEHRPDLLRVLDADFDNFMSGWAHLGSRGSLEAIERAVGGLCEYLDIRGRRSEGVLAFRAMRRQLEGLPVSPILERVQARLALREGMDCFWQGRMDEAEPNLERALALGRRLGAAKIEGESSRQLGVIAQLRGDRDTAEARFNAALETFRAAGIRHGMAFCYQSLGQLARARGETGVAQALLNDSLALFTEVSDTRNEAMVLNDLGNIAVNERDFVKARDVYKRCLSTFETLGFAQGVAVIKSNLGDVERELGNLNEALRLTLESLELKRSISDARGMANTQIQLGWIYTDLGAFNEARPCLLSAFQIACARQETPLALTALIPLANLEFHTGNAIKAAHWLSIVATHSASSAENRNAATRKLETLGEIQVVDDPEAEFSAVIELLRGSA